MTEKKPVRVNQLRIAKDRVRLRELKDGDKVTGYEIDYRDGRQAAVVRPDTIHRKMRQD